MDIGTLIMVIIVGLFLLFLLFLPKITGSSTKTIPDDQREAEREKAYRRGLVIGGLMEEARETQPTGTDPQHLIEQVMIEQTIIERLHHSHDNDAPGDQHH